MMTKMFPIIMTFIVLSQYLHAAKEYDNWYFGENAAISFMTGTPISLSDSKIETDEGCASISDIYGNLLFYTDGISIWDRNHEVMPNGVELYGNISSTHSAAILKSPRNSNIYYVFTVDWRKGEHGLCYSIVDMTEREGYGDVIEKNVQLIKHCNEKMAIVRDLDSYRYWLAAKDDSINAMKAFSIDASGIDTLPVISMQGELGPFETGCMKFDSKGRKLAAVNQFESTVFLMDFDVKNGIFSNLKVIKDNLLDGAYGVEFAPNSRFLYISAIGDSSRLYQFDILEETVEDILKSAALLAYQNYRYAYSGLQIGPDGVIYLSKYLEKYLGMLRYPNSKGKAALRNFNTMLLKKGKCRFKLPDALYFDKYSGINSNAPLCEGETLQFTSTALRLSDNFDYIWQGPNGWSSSLKAPVIEDVKIKNEGVYSLRIMNGPDTLAYSEINIEIFETPVLDIQNDGPLSFCDGGAVTLKSNLDDDRYYYRWSNGSDGPEITVDQSGRYSLVVSTPAACSDTVFADVTVHPTPTTEILAYPGTIVCMGDSIKLFLDKSFAIYNWSTGEKTPEIIVKESGQFSIEAIDSNGCTAFDTIEVELPELKIKVEPVPIVFPEFCLGTWDSLEIVIENTGVDRFTIDALYLENSPEGLELSTNIELPFQHPGSLRNKMKLTYGARESGFTNSNLVIEISSPCEKILKYPIQTNIADAGLHIYIPDTSLAVSFRSACIPVYARWDCEIPGTDIYVDYQSSISFNRYIFAYEQISDGVITNVSSSPICKIDFNDDGVLIDSKDKILTKICGTPVLGDEESTAMIIEDFVLNDSLVRVYLENGRITTSGVCREDLARVRRFKELSISVNPNPVSGKADIAISGSEQGKMTLSICNVQGSLVYKENIDKSDDEILRQVDLSSIPSGLYNIILSSVNQTSVEKVYVVQ